MGKWGEETLVVEVIISSENWYRGPPRIRFSSIQFLLGDFRSKDPSLEDPV